MQYVVFSLSVNTGTGKQDGYRSGVSCFEASLHLGGWDETFSYIFITDYFEYFTPTLAYLSI